MPPTRMGLTFQGRGASAIHVVDAGGMAVAPAVHPAAVLAGRAVEPGTGEPHRSCVWGCGGGQGLGVVVGKVLELISSSVGVSALPGFGELKLSPPPTPGEKLLPPPKFWRRDASEGSPARYQPHVSSLDPQPFHLPPADFFFPLAKQVVRTMQRMRRMRRVSPSPSPTPSPSPSLLMWVWQRSPDVKYQGTSGQLRG